MWFLKWNRETKQLDDLRQKQKRRRECELFFKCVCVCVCFLSVLTCTSESALTGCSWNQVSLPWYFCRSSFFTATLPEHINTQRKVSSKHKSLSPKRDLRCVFGFERQQSLDKHPHTPAHTCSHAVNPHVRSSPGAGVCKMFCQWPWNDPVLCTLKLSVYNALKTPHKQTGYTNHTLREIFQLVVGGHTHTHTHTQYKPTNVKTDTPDDRKKHPPLHSRTPAFSCRNYNYRTWLRGVGFVKGLYTFS